jgi:hypothetical protein
MNKKWPTNKIIIVDWLLNAEFIVKCRSAEYCTEKEEKKSPKKYIKKEFWAVKQLVIIPGLLHSIKMQDWIKRNSLH